MTDEKLRQLLQSADAAAGAAAVGTRNLTAEVYRLLRRRRRIQLTSISLALCLILALLPLLPSHPTPSRPVARQDPSQIKNELSLIRAKADSQSATIDRMIQHQHSLNIRTTARKLAADDPLDYLQRQRDSAARLLLHDADRARAPDQYRRVIQLFPETPWASIARQRLGQSRT